MPSSSSGLGRRPLKAEITGSNPVGGMSGVLVEILFRTYKTTGTNGPIFLAFRSIGASIHFT